MMPREPRPLDRSEGADMAPAALRWLGFGLILCGVASFAIALVLS